MWILTDTIFVLKFIFTDILLMLSLKNSNLKAFWYHLQKVKKENTWESSSKAVCIIE